MTEQSARSRAVVDLGKRLVIELNLGDSVDTLGRWMAHYLAELIQEVEVASGNDRLAKQERLRDSILAFWARRSELPIDTRPFGEFEPILRALASLDPEGGTSRYFSLSRAPDSESNESEETRNWIELAKGLDYTSKVLINHCLISAAGSSLDKSQKWVKLASDAAIEEGIESCVTNFISKQRDLMEGVDPNSRQRSILSGRQQKLEAFLSLASLLTDDIQAQLMALQPQGVRENPPSNHPEE